MVSFGNLARRYVTASSYAASDTIDPSNSDYFATAGVSESSFVNLYILSMICGVTFSYTAFCLIFKLFIHSTLKYQILQIRGYL